MSERYILGDDACPAWADGAAKTGAALRATMHGGGPFKLIVDDSAPWSEVAAYFDPELYLWPTVDEFWHIFFGESSWKWCLTNPSMDEVRRMYDARERYRKSLRYKIRQAINFVAGYFGRKAK